MGRLGRGTLWVMLPGVAWLRSRRRRDDRLLEQIQQQRAPLEQAEPELEVVGEIRRRRREIGQRLAAAGFVGQKRDQARRQLAHLTAGEGMSVDQALDRIAPRHKT